MATVVVDNTNLEAQVAIAQGLKPEIPTPEAKAPEAPPQAEVKAEEAPKESPEDDTEDAEGLTPAQKRDLSAKMLAAINKKHRQMKEAEEFAAEQYNERKLAEERASRIQAEIEALREQSKPAPKSSEAPDRAKFATEAEYQDALIEHKVNERMKVREAEDAKRREAERMEKITEAAKARVAKAIELVPDWQATMEAADTPVPPAIGNYMQESELFAELGYHFAKHPEDLERLAEMPTRTYADIARLGVAIGKIESTLQPFSAKSEKATAKAESSTVPETESKKATAPAESQTAKEPSQAAQPSKRVSAPIKPLPSGGAAVEKEEREMTAAEALAAWQKKRGVNLERRKRH